jgi:hypothetical protein
VKYAYDRLQADSRTSLPELIQGVLGLAQIEPSVRVLDSTGARLPGTEVVRFANGGCEHVAIFRNPQFDDGGWGDLPTSPERGWAGEIDNRFLEKEAQITVSWPAAASAYDVRRKQDLGATAKVEVTLDPWSPVVLTRASKSIPQFRLQVADQAQAGDDLAVTVIDEDPLPEGTFRIVRFEFATPQGSSYDLYARNVLIKATPHTEHFPLACNDPEGRWQISARDVMTGRVVQAAFNLRA